MLDRTFMSFTFFKSAFSFLTFSCVHNFDILPIQSWITCFSLPPQSQLFESDGLILLLLLVLAWLACLQKQTRARCTERTRPQSSHRPPSDEFEEDWRRRLRWILACHPRPHLPFWDANLPGLAGWQEHSLRSGCPPSLRRGRRSVKTIQEPRRGIPKPEWLRISDTPMLRAQHIQKKLGGDGKAIAIAYPLEKTGWKHTASYQNLNQSSEVMSMNTTAYKFRDSEHAGMMKKKLAEQNSSDLSSNVKSQTNNENHNNDIKKITIITVKQKHIKTIYYFIAPHPDLRKNPS